MSFIDISTVDLNLLVVLDAVLDERSATRAAARLHVTQSAISAGLRRCRELFGDALLVRNAHGLDPTPRALALRADLKRLLDDARQLLAKDQQGSVSRREFRLACTDAVSSLLVPRLSRRMMQTMPEARLRVLTLDRLVAGDGLARGDVDLLIGIPPTLPSGCRTEHVYEDRLVCVVRRDHPTVSKRLSLDQYTNMPHVEVALFGEPDDRIDRALARAGRTRTVQLAVPHFSTIPFAIAESDCVATIGQALALHYASVLPLRILPPPIELPAIAVRQIWHRRCADDEALQRLRAIVRDLGEAIDAQRARSASAPTRRK